MKIHFLFYTIFVLIIIITDNVIGQNLEQILGKCHKKSSNFDSCMKDAFNELTVFFKSGLPKYNVAPLDPHRAPYVELRRGDPNFIGGFRLLLTNASEYGWSNSKVTKFRTDAEHDRIVYSQYFPEKSLDGEYDFTLKMLGISFHNKGLWNMTLYDYSQTTSVTRVKGPGSLLKIRVEVDKIGNMVLQITNLFGGKKFIEWIADFLIRNVWQPGVPFIKPIINELVSTAFTDIFSESFRNFPFEQFIKD